MLSKLKAINSVVKDEVPYVNYGGCAYYASMIQQRIRELGGNTEAGLLYYSPPHGALHVFTIFKEGGIEYFHDGAKTMLLSEFEYPEGDWERASDCSTIDVVQQNKWNDMFTAQTDVPILKDIIEMALGPFATIPHFHNELTGEEA